MHAAGCTAQIGSNILIRVNILKVGHGLRWVGFIVDGSQAQRDLLSILCDIDPASIVNIGNRIVIARLYLSAQSTEFSS